MIGNALRVALGIFSGRIIYNFGFQKRLRAFLKPIFTGGVVKANGICSACFLRKRRRCGESLSRGTALGDGGKVSGTAQRRPLGGAGERSEPEGVASLRGRITRHKNRAAARGFVQQPCFPTYILSSTFFPVSGSGMPSSASIIAMRIYTPLCT